MESVSTRKKIQKENKKVTNIKHFYKTLNFVPLVNQVRYKAKMYYQVSLPTLRKEMKEDKIQKIFSNVKEWLAEDPKSVLASQTEKFPVICFSGKLVNKNNFLSQFLCYVDHQIVGYLS